MSAMQRRVAAAQATRDRFYGKPFKFGRTDCGQMIKWHLRKIGCPLKIATKAGTYHSLLGAKKANRSEEHTSELQSLMRISYAVFCLKKKIKNHNNIIVAFTYRHNTNNTKL